MIKGEKSILKGVLLFVYAVILIISLIGCCTKEVDAVIVIGGILNFAVGAWIIYSLYKDWSKDE